MAGINSFSKRLAEYKRWRDGLITTIGAYQDWIQRQNLASGEEDLRIYELIDTLKADKLNIALVAEFSRGKTELINALFFADYKQRLLPSEAGRTTMCPTELMYDEKLEPCLRLLPIETRSSSMTIAEYKRTPIHWTSLPLDIGSAKQMTETFHEFVKSKTVTVRDARELGLYHESDGPAGAGGTVEIPVWRHAVINYPHPLLKQGLVILDTPGLNSLGTEPELTLSMLPKAHVVLFVLAADTGVTKSDLDVWNNHVRMARNTRQNGCLALLNKIDTLWDELRTEEVIADSIARQTRETARVLDIPETKVFPVSAQKGLLGKIKADHSLVERSGLLALEIKLSEDLIPSKQKYLRDKVVGEIGAMIETTEAMVAARLNAANAQLAELKSLGGKSLNVIQDMVARLRKEKEAYDKKLDSFQATRQVLSDQIKILLEYLSMSSFDRLIDKTRTEMQESWTTHGLKVGMVTFFKGATETMDKVNKQSQQIKGLVEAIYTKFHTEHGLAKIRPVNFSLLPYRSALARLQEEAEAFRNSPVMVMTEQHFVVKKFFITLVSRARTVFDECNTGAKAWSKAIMTPILSQIREHKTLMERRLENLKKIQDNLDSLGERIAAVEATRQNLIDQQKTTQSMLAKINQPLGSDA
jgi:hypothetical protein